MNAPAQPQAFLARIDSLADAVRLRILRLLETQELSVAELCEILQMPQSTVSRHLKLLADQGWAVNRRQATANLYRMRLGDGTDDDRWARRLWLLARERAGDWAAFEQDRLRMQWVVARRREDPRALFEGAAGDWDQIRQELYGSHVNHTALLALLPAEAVIADLGCGTGALSAELAPHVGRVIGVDQSPAMLRAARRRTADRPNVEFKAGDLEHLPLAAGSCDGALLVLVLSYIPDPAGVLAQAARILKPGGSLVVLDLLQHDRDDFRRQMGQHWPGFDPRKLRAWLRGAGLQPTSCRPLAPEPQAKGPALLLATGRRL